MLTTIIKKIITGGTLLLLSVAVAPLSQAQDKLQPAGQTQPVISIIIDDLGNQKRSGMQAIELPGALTYAIMPHRPYTRLLAEQAHRHSKEVMVHMPMEAENGKALGPGALTQCMQERQVKNMVRRNFAAVPHARGFNNHMGSLLTASPTLMRWVMQATMFHDNLYFVDSRTTKYSVALQQANQRGIRGTSRDIFLDYQGDDATIVADQLAKLIQRARREGSALAIGHPYPATLATVSELIAQRHHRRERTWPMYSSR